MYDETLIVRSAVERQLEIIGEALNRAAAADPNLNEQISELRKVVALRNRLIHGYDAVDDEIVWDVVQNKIAVLEADVRRVLDEREPSSENRS